MAHDSVFDDGSERPMTYDIPPGYDPTTAPYRLVMGACRSGDHDGCAGHRDRTSHIDPRATVCICCEADHDEAAMDGWAERLTEWVPGKKVALRQGDPCRLVNGKSDGVYRFIALLVGHDGRRLVEVSDEAGRIRRVDPDIVRRIARTRDNAPRRQR